MTKTPTAAPLKHTARIFAAGLFCSAAVTHAGVLTVSPLAFRGSMPYVQSENGQIAIRINNLVFLDMLGVPAPAKLQDGLREKKQEDGPQSPMDLAYEVVRNDERILALSISAEGCGAYCENYTNYFNFDAATGRNLVAGEIFTPGGAGVLSQKVDRARLAQVKAEIARVRREAKAQQQKEHASAGKVKTNDPVPAAEDDPVLTDTVEMYEQCVVSLTDPANRRDKSVYTAEMKIGKDAVTFIRGRCSIHALRALDELGEIKTAFSMNDLVPHLSEYGKRVLLGGSGNAVPPANPYNQLLVGKVGQAPITMRLGSRKPDGSVSGTYYYNKYRTAISLFGKATGNTIELQESDSKEQTPPVIRATISGESMKGHWIGTKEIAFEARP